MKIIRNTKRCSSSGKLPQRILKKTLTYENPDAGPHRNDWCLALVGCPHVLLILTDFLFSFSLSLFLNKFRKANVLVNRKTAFSGLQSLESQNALMHSVDTLRIIWYVYKWIVLRYTYVNRIWDCSSPFFF